MTDEASVAGWRDRLAVTRHAGADGPAAEPRPAHPRDHSGDRRDFQSRHRRRRAAGSELTHLPSDRESDRKRSRRCRNPNGARQRDARSVEPGTAATAGDPPLEHRRHGRSAERRRRPTLDADADDRVDRRRGRVRRRRQGRESKRLTPVRSRCHRFSCRRPGTTSARRFDSPPIRTRRARAPCRP